MSKIISNFIRITVSVTALILLVWSNLNFFTMGTIIGWILFGSIIALCVFWKKICGLIRRLWSRIWGKIAVISFGSIVALAVGISVFFSVNMAIYEERPVEKAEAVIILGCQVKGEEPSVMLKTRIEAGLSVLRENPAAICIASGGKGNGEEISEAECIRRCLTESGIDESRIFLEDKSVSTEENIRFSAEILKEKGISENIVISTNEFHQYRAYLYARKYGLKTGSHSSKTRKSNLLNYWLREQAALLPAIF